MLVLVLALIAVASAQECQRMCTMQHEPVCGTDGKTYSNDCQLKSLNCLARTPVLKAYNGPCTARQNACPRACTMQYAPVCGSDGKTYGNECQLRSQACIAKKNVQVLYQGACSAPMESCPMLCTMQYDPVCGTDGKTYGNECQLTSQSCMAKNAVTKAHNGACKAVACNKICTMQYDPVCGTDGVTYGNECQLTSQACMAKKAVFVAKRGVC